MRIQYQYLGCLLLTACGGKSTVDLGDNSPSAGWKNLDASATSVAQVNVPQTLYAGGDFVSHLAIDEETLAAVITDPNTYTTRLIACQLNDCQGTVQTLHSIPGLYGDSQSIRSGPIAEFLLSHGEVIWYAGFSDAGPLGIMACPVVGCPGGPREIAPIDNNSSRIASLAADSEHLYWVVEQAVAGINTYSVARCPRTGCAVPDIQELPAASWEATNNPGPKLTLSSTSQALYAYGDKTILSVPLDFSAQATVFYKPQQSTGGVVAVGTDVYFASSALVGNISRCPAAGCADGPIEVAAAQRWPSDLVADEKQAYWLQQGSDRFLTTSGWFEAMRVASASTVSSSGSMSPMSILADIPSYWYCGLQLNSHHLYWCELASSQSSNSIIRMLKR